MVDARNLRQSDGDLYFAHIKAVRYASDSLEIFLNRTTNVFERFRLGRAL